MVRIIGIEHVQLAMPAGRERDARAFYSGVLGLAEIPKPPELVARGGCWFEGTSAKVHLGVEADFRPARKAHPALLVDDLVGLKAELSANGIAVIEDGPVDSRARCFVADPFGNRIELMQG